MNPMECEKTLDWFRDALDRAPFAASQSDIASHLATCDECRAEAAGLLADNALLQELGQAGESLAPDGPLVHALRQRLRTLPTLLPGTVNDRHLSDEDLEWLAAAGTPLPSWMDPSPEKK